MNIFIHPNTCLSNSKGFHILLYFAQVSLGLDGYEDSVFLVCSFLGQSTFHELSISLVLSGMKSLHVDYVLYS
jgi:hypothetical protein